MSSEDKIIRKLIAWVKASDNIRALLLTGSRANPAAPVDDLSDYDVELYAREIEPFLNDESWITQFGEIMLRWPQHPSPTFSGDWITQLVQYLHGLRIDFQISHRLSAFTAWAEGPRRVLVDKDGVCDNQSVEMNSSFKITPPDEEAFASRLNAFWWDILYVPKALLRGELNYARFMLDSTIRFEKLQPLIEWYIGATAGWEVNSGQYGRWFKRYLPEDLWLLYESTFAGADLRDNWRALFATIEFTRAVATAVAQALSFSYPFQTDARVSATILKLSKRGLS